MIVYWHPIRRPGYPDPDDIECPVLREGQSGWILLQQVSAMPKGRPISFQNAWRVLFYEIHLQMDANNILGDESGTATWIMENEIKWLTGQGYQIQLTGDEFDFMDGSEYLSETAA